MDIDDNSDSDMPQSAPLGADPWLDLVLADRQTACFDWHVPSGAITFHGEFATTLGLTMTASASDLAAWTAGLDAQEREPFQAAMQRLREGGDAGPEGVHRLPRSGGSRGGCTLRGRVVERDAAGLPRRVIGMIRSCDDDRSAARPADGFMAGMSHELRSPLAALLACARLMREEGDLKNAPPRRLELLDGIESSGRHLLSLINNVLDLSKLQSGAMAVESIESSVVEVVRGVESMLRPGATAKGLEFRVCYCDALPDRIITDPTRLRQILVNLVGNALKFTESGHVTIQASTVHADGPRLHVDVTDTGPGMDVAQIERLFLPFSQGDPSITRRFGGTGLGLVLSKSFAGLLGGDLTLVCTKLGRGTTFRLDLPLRAVPHTAAAKNVAMAHDAPPRPHVALAGRVLLAEDGILNQTVIRRVLERDGLSVEVADNGRLALECIRSACAGGRPHDLVLTDIQMPVLDGFGLVQAIRDLGLDVPVVALTASEDTHGAARFLAAGFTDFSIKPIMREELLAICRRYLGAAVNPESGA